AERVRTRERKDGGDLCWRRGEAGVAPVARLGQRKFEARILAQVARLSNLPRVEPVGGKRARGDVVSRDPVLVCVAKRAVDHKLVGRVVDECVGEAPFHGVSVEDACELVTLIAVLPAGGQARGERSLHATDQQQRFCAQYIVRLVPDVRDLDLRLPRGGSVDEFPSEAKRLGGCIAARPYEREFG